MSRGLPAATMAAMDKSSPVIEALRPGTFRDMHGKDWTLTREDVAQLAAGYDPAGAPSPVVVGHPKHNDPAFGWIAQAALGNDDKLRLTLRDLDPAFSAAVEARRYRKVSTALFTPDSPHNPKPGQWYIRHLGFLGAMPPAVTGLQPVQFASGDEGVVEFAAPLEGPWYSVGSIFRRLREWIIAKDGLEAADGVISDWQVQMVEDAARPQPDSTSPGFAAGDPENPPAPGVTGGAAGGADPGTNSNTHPAERTSAAEGSVSGAPGASAPGQSGQAATTDSAEKPGVSPSGAKQAINQEPTVTEQEAAQLRESNARLQAELAAARQAVADHQVAERHADNVAFAAGLHREGRLPTAAQARVVAVLDAVGALETEVEFAAGDATVKEAPAVALREVLKTLPVAVPLGERAAAEGNGAGAPEFAAPAGYSVDAEALDLHSRALAYQAANPKADYLAAVAAVAKGA